MHTHKILKIAHSDIPAQNNLNKELGISKVLAQILINRGMDSPAKAHNFLNPRLKDFHDPYSFTDMPKAVARIKKAAADREKVLLFGDYDTDGVTSIALLKESLDKIAVDTLYYLPHRVKEGYGLSKNILQLAKERGVKLLVTADCGTSSHKEVEELKRNHIDTIITDHHECALAALPPASAVINPKCSFSGYQFRDLAGVGVAYKLAQALSGAELLEELDLVCLGTIADSVPLTDENRVIAKEGLARLPQSRRAGLKAMIENAGIKNRKFNSTYVSFILGPRINASGRMDTAETSLKLLMSKSEQEAAELLKVIEGHNRRRQKVEAGMLEEAQGLLGDDFRRDSVIVVAKEDWHRGVLGIVASKLADRFYRPAIVISIDGKLCKGSGRSIKNFHLFDALAECGECLDSFGGHSHAVGLVIDKNKIAEFKESINRLAKERLTLEDLLPAIEVDMQIELADLSRDLIRELEKLEPFGEANPEPLFFTPKLKLKGEPQVLGRGTLKFWVTDGNFTYQAIGFGMSHLLGSLEAADCFDLIYTPKIDSWSGEESVLLEAKELFFR